MRSNNLFDFATSELSQDAFICWAINWFNDSGRPRLQKMASDILTEITGISDVYKVDIYRQEFKIDVLLILNDSIPVIIEDKTFTSEHGNQINRYVEKVKEQAQKNNGVIKIRECKYSIDIDRILTVFWKTGFYYDNDKRVVADKIMDCQSLLKLLRPYYNDSEILADYIDKLKNDEEWYFEHKEYWQYDDEFDNSYWNLNVAKHQIAQYSLFRDIFPEDGWENLKGETYIPAALYHGSSFGRPFTEMWIWNDKYCDGDEFQVFWRIDTDKRGPYLSLRFYEPKYDKSKEERHCRMYDSMLGVVKNLINKGNYPFDWEKVNPGNKKKYKEAALFHFTFNEDFREKWSVEKRIFISSIQRFSEEFINEVEKYKEF